MLNNHTMAMTYQFMHAEWGYSTRYSSVLISLGTPIIIFDTPGILRKIEVTIAQIENISLR